MKIILATGGTGGHLFPALQTARELSREEHEIFFCGSFGDLAIEKIKVNGFDFRNLCAKGLSFRNFGVFFNSVIAMAKAVKEAFCVLKKWKPDVVAGFGGYGAFPVVLSAVFLRYPTLIHEQNVIPGKANALLAKWVKRVAISFPQSEKYFSSKKTVLTGCPCNFSQDQLKEKDSWNRFFLEEGKITFLVFGGSQGSECINAVFVQTIPILKEYLDFQVIHISGKKDYEKLKKMYKESGIRVALFPFLDKIKEAYQCANLVISRAGAVTIAEIVTAKIPAVLIPYPYAGGHQKYNAQALCDSGVACMIEEKNLSSEILKAAILKMLNEKGSFSSTTYFPDAEKRLAQVIKEVSCL